MSDYQQKELYLNKFEASKREISKKNVRKKKHNEII